LKLGFSLGEVFEVLVKWLFFEVESRASLSPLRFFLGGAVWGSVGGFLVGSACGRLL
jgi:hypothetical protein